MSLKIDVNRIRPGVFSGLVRKYSDVALAVILLIVLMLLVLPVPSLLLDLAIALNFSFSLILLASAIHLRSALELTAFPSLLLLTTLFRLGLAVATTKMILLHAHAGDIIHTFGSLVVGGNIVVGLVIFSLLCAVQFIVVAKGGDRVAEVGARFTLDSIPGRQMSIDADLRAGSIGREEAKNRRDALEKGIQFYGAMDGAMKFVKGDAIIGLLIAFVNILGGIAVGMIYRGMSLADAMQTYTVLTVGDGLVSQIPSLIVSITAGLIITRADTGNSESDDDHLGGSIFDQLGIKFRPLLMASVAALLMACIPGFPSIQFLVIAVALALLAWAARRQGHDEVGFESAPLRNLTRDGSTYAAGMLDVVEMGTSPPLAIRLGESAIEAMEPLGFDAVLGAMRRRLMRETGLPFPGLAVGIDPLVAADEYRIEVNATTVASGKLFAGQLFVLVADADADPAVGELEFVDGVGHGYWADPNTSQLDDSVEVLAANDVLVLHLQAVCMKWGATFVGTEEVSFLLDRLGILFPHLVEALREMVPASAFASILRRLLEDGVSVRNLRGIVEAIVTIGGEAKTEELAVRAVRVSLRRQILEGLKDRASGTLPCLLLHPDLDRMLVRAIEIMPNAESRLVLDAAQTAAMTRTIQHAMQYWGDGLVVLTGPLVRAHLADLIRHANWDVRVLAMDELDVGVVPVATRGVIELYQEHADPFAAPEGNSLD